MDLLVSACLMGNYCRFDGSTNGLAKELRKLMARHHFIPVCPEQLGGLPTPRAPAERCGDRVVSNKGEDVTAAYDKGAQEALRLARCFNCRYAILKSRSPSCGSQKVYDGTFSGTLVPGMGVTAQLLSENGITVLDETQLDQLPEE